MYRSARLAINGSGAEPGTSVSLRGNASELPADYYSVQSMDFSFRWRDKDYGDCCIEDWCFSVTLKPSHINFSFWRNFVFFTAERIYFGEYNSWSHIYKNDLGQAIFHRIICGKLEEVRLAGDFDSVVAAFKAVMVDCNIAVKDSVVYKFSVGEITSKYIEEHRPPPTTVVFA